MMHHVRETHHLMSAKEVIMVESLQPVMRVIPLEERRQYIPSDVMGIVAYMAYRRQRNLAAPAENEKIKTYNESAAKYGHPLRYEIVVLPEETALMISDKTFIITLQDYTRVSIPRGIFECPVDLADHWYMKNHGVKKYNLSPQMAAGFAPMGAQADEYNPAVKPTIAELETLLKKEDDTPITINPDGTITKVESDNSPSGVDVALSSLASKK
jgi:hypothetical protein